jgi:hypothetical protein
MQQRQPRLGDILDDYCPRERRLTNHAVVAMIGAEVKQTRCTTCDAEHEYKHAKVPRQRRKAETPPALYTQVAAGAPKRVAHEENGGANGHAPVEPLLADVVDDPADVDVEVKTVPDSDSVVADVREEILDDDDQSTSPDREEGPVHRPLIRASLPRPEGQPPPTRPGPDFTIRQPGGRANRFRPRHQRSGQQFQGNRANGNVAGPRGRQQQGSMAPRAGRRHGPGRKRSK